MTYREYQIWKNGIFEGAVRLTSDTKAEIAKALGIEVETVTGHRDHTLYINNDIELSWIATIW